MPHPPQQARSRATVARLLEAAGHLFVERGFAATTTNHIAERAEVSVGSLYQFFPHKNAVFDALQAEWVTRLGVELDRAMAGAEESPLETVVDRVLRTHVALNESPPGLLRMLLTTSDRGGPHSRALSRATGQRVEAFLKARGVPMPPARRRVVVQVVEHIANGIYCVPQPTGVQAAEVVRQTRAALVAYLRPIVADLS